MWQDVKTPTTTTYALLGLLSVRSWTGYELTQQVRRSLKFAWPSSESHLYREQKLLVAMQWAQVENEPVGKRFRNRYTITALGCKEFRKWLRTPPEAPSLEIEAIVRMFFADQAGPDELIAALNVTAEHIREALLPMDDIVKDYLQTGGPFPKRAHLIAMSADLITDLLARIETFSMEAAQEVASWDSTRGIGQNSQTKARFEGILDRRRH